MRLHASHFDKLVERIDGFDGNNASFYKLKLTDEGIGHYRTEGTSPPSFIGKEYSDDELSFYEQQQEVKKNTDDGDVGTSKLLEEYTFEYVGTITLVEKIADQPLPEDRKLLVLKSLLGTYAKLRLLEFKTRENPFDIRLERFDGQPEALASRDPLLDINKIVGKESKCEINSGAQRKVLRKMSLSDALMYYVDLYQESEILTEEYSEERKIEESGEKKLSRSEVAEIVLDETVRKLGKLLCACHNAIPQKWHGSSIGIGYDTENFLTNSEDRIRSNVIVCILDCKGSKVQTNKSLQELSQAEQDQIKKSWESYLKGIFNLFYHAAKRYHNEFSNIHAWTKMTVCVMDYDSLSKDDFMGEITLYFDELNNNEENEYVLKKQGSEKRNTTSEVDHGKHGCIKLKISWQDAHLTSRLKGSWHITIYYAKKLPVKDIVSSDPYCSLKASSKGDEGENGYLEFQHQTKVIPRSLNPIFGRTLEVPLLRHTNLTNTLNRIYGSTIDPLKVKKLFGTGISDNKCCEEAYTQLNTLYKEISTQLPSVQ